MSYKYNGQLINNETGKEILNLSKGQDLSAQALQQMVEMAQQSNDADVRNFANEVVSKVSQAGYTDWAEVVAHEPAFVSSLMNEVQNTPNEFNDPILSSIKSISNDVTAYASLSDEQFDALQAQGHNSFKPKEQYVEVLNKATGATGIKDTVTGKVMSREEYNQLITDTANAQEDNWEEITVGGVDNVSVGESVSSDYSNLPLV